MAVLLFAMLPRLPLSLDEHQALDWFGLWIGTTRSPVLTESPHIEINAADLSTSDHAVAHRAKNGTSRAQRAADALADVLLDLGPDALDLVLGDLAVGRGERYGEGQALVA